MGNNLRSACDEILQKVATVKDRVPGVVAMITDRSANIYEGAAGERILGAGQAMTTDTVFAIYSTTKAMTGTASRKASSTLMLRPKTTPPTSASSKCSMGSTPTGRQGCGRRSATSPPAC